MALFLSQSVNKAFYFVLCFRVSIFCGFFIPLDCIVKILVNSNAIKITIAQHILSILITSCYSTLMACRLKKPRNGYFQILLDPFSFIVTHSYHIGIFFITCCCEFLV